MGSVIDYGKCPHCSTEDAYVTDFNYRTGEEDGFCMACGYSYTYAFKRDDNGDLVRTPVEYPRKNCVLGVKDMDTGELIYTKPLNEIENFTEQTFEDWLNSFSWNKKPDDTTPDGHYNVFYLGREKPEQLFYLGNRITVGENPDVIVVYKVEIIEESTPNYGVINVFTEDGSGNTFVVKESSSKAELVADAEKLVEENKNIKFISVTKFNEEKRVLEEIFTYGFKPVFKEFDYEDDEAVF